MEANAPDFRVGRACFTKARVGYAIGDIHGRADLLARLLDCIDRDVANMAPREPPILIFVGDYIDRGGDSRGVIELLVSARLKTFECRFLKGNHEAAMAAFLDDPWRYRAWLLYGGRDTIASYGAVPPRTGSGRRQHLKSRRQFLESMPKEHATFFERLEAHCFYGDYLFVHAGIDPKRAFWRQDERDLLWIREGFLDCEEAFPFVVVHGHTPSSTPYRDHRRIGLDTGAYFSGELTAVKLVGEEASFLSVNENDIAVDPAALQTEFS